MRKFPDASYIGEHYRKTQTSYNATKKAFYKMDGTGEVFFENKACKRIVFTPAEFEELFQPVPTGKNKDGQLTPDNCKKQGLTFVGEYDLKFSNSLSHRKVNIYREKDGAMFYIARHSGNTGSRRTITQAEIEALQVGVRPRGRQLKDPKEGKRVYRKVGLTPSQNEKLGKHPTKIVNRALDEYFAKEGE